jgi:hypothetical protein
MGGEHHWDNRFRIREVFFNPYQMFANPMFFGGDSIPKREENMFITGDSRKRGKQIRLISEVDFARFTESLWCGGVNVKMIRSNEDNRVRIVVSVSLVFEESIKLVYFFRGKHKMWDNGKMLFKRLLDREISKKKNYPKSKEKKK